MANETEEISWTYNNNHPYMGIRLKTFDGNEHPIDGEELVLLDTGFSGGIILPIKIYNQLKLQNWENPEPLEFELTDGKVLEMLEADGYIFVPKLKKQFDIKFYRSADETQDGCEIVLGINFINNFRLLLDGPSKTLSVLE